MLEVFFHAIEDLDDRRGRPRQPRNAAPLEMHFEHLLMTDPASSLVADDHGGMIAFGIVMRRGDQAFLSFLFVEPSWQGRGIGRAVFDACLDALGDGQRLRVATCAEADQPVSTGLYAAMGLAPRTPVYLLRGAVPDSALPGPPDGTRAVAVDRDGAARLDEELVGYRRAQDHAFWASGGRAGAMFVDASGSLLGYGYAHPSGRIGPVAAVDPGLLAGFVGYLVRAMPVLEGRQVVLPGPSAAMSALLAAGLRIDGTPAVYCSSTPAPAFERYIPMSFALL